MRGVQEGVPLTILTSVRASLVPRPPENERSGNETSYERWMFILIGAHHNSAWEMSDVYSECVGGSLRLKGASSGGVKKYGIGGGRHMHGYVCDYYIHRYIA